jgi:hypothetical protein
MGEDGEDRGARGRGQQELSGADEVDPVDVERGREMLREDQRHERWIAVRGVLLLLVLVVLVWVRQTYLV